MLKKYKNIIIGAVVVVVLFFLYSAFLKGDGNTDTLVSESPEGLNSDVTMELLSILLEIRSITLNEKIFSDEGFSSLEDFSQEIPQEPVGRPNPFLPIGTDPVTESSVEPIVESSN